MPLGESGRCFRRLIAWIDGGILLGGVSLLAVGCYGGENPSPSDSAVSVRLSDGQGFRAQVDPRTDGKRLWLRWETSHAEVLRSVTWENVESAEIAGDKITGQDFRDLVRQIRQDTPPFPVQPPPASLIVFRGARAPEGRPDSTAAGAAEEAPRRVTSLAFDVKAANWDADVEVDGLKIRVSPLDGEGRMAPVAGRLKVELIAEQTGIVKRPQPFRQIARWTRTVRPADFGPLGAAYRLEYQGVQPEFDRRLAPHGAVYARLSVPGQGTFAATESMVRLQPYSAVRDRLEQTTKHRFFPQEFIRGGRR